MLDAILDKTVRAAAKEEIARVMVQVTRIKKFLYTPGTIVTIEDLYIVTHYGDFIGYPPHRRYFYGNERPMHVRIACTSAAISATIDPGFGLRLVRYTWLDIDSFFDEIETYLQEWYKVIYN